MHYILWVWFWFPMGQGDINVWTTYPTYEACIRAAQELPKQIRIPTNGDHDEIRCVPTDV